MKRKTVRTIAGVICLAIYLHVPGVLPQPVYIPEQEHRPFDNLEMDPAAARAAEERSQPGWEEHMEAAVRFREEEWTRDALAAIDAEVLLNMRSDFFNPEPAFDQYLRASLETQMAEQKAAWLIAARDNVNAERVPFLAAAIEEARRKIAADRKNSLREYDAGGDPERRRYETSYDAWRDEYQADLEAGLNRYNTAQRILDEGIVAYDRELNETAALFENNLRDVRDSEQVVRNGIGSALVELAGYLSASDFFYQESCAGAVCTIDRGTRNAAGIELQNFINTLQQGLTDGDPLSTLSQQVTDYFALQEQRATDRRDYWETQERGNINYDVLDNSSPQGSGHAQDPGALWVGEVVYDAGQVNARNAANSANKWAEIESWLNGGSSTGTLAKGILRHYENGDSSILYDYLINYTGSNTDTREIETLLSADIRDETGAYFPNGQLEWNPATGGGSWDDLPVGGISDPSVSVVGGQWRHTRQYGYNTATFSNSGRAVFYSGTDVEIRWHRQTGEDAEGEPLYGATSTTAYTLFRHAVNERFMVNANWIDNTAIANTATWNGYLNEVSGVLDHWRDNILPAITTWESQKATYEQTYADWQTTAAAQRTVAHAQYEAATTNLANSKTTWLARVGDEYRLGSQAWQERADDVKPGTVATARILQHESDRITRALSIIDFPTVDHAADRALAKSGKPDQSLLDNVDAAFAKGLLGSRQLALVSAANDRGVARRDAIIEQLAKQAIDAGYAVEVSENGTITGTRDIASGKALRIAGSRGTSEYDYEMELQNQSLQVTGADAFKLAQTGALFAEQWDLAKVEAESRANLAEYSQRLGTKVNAEQQNFKAKDSEQNHYIEEFERDRAGQIAAAKAAEEKKSGWMSAFTDSLFTSMLGGLNFGQATQSYVQSQTTSLWAEATGLPRGLMSGLAGGMKFHDATKTYIKTETTNLIAEKAAKDSGVPAGVLTGILNGETPEDAIAAYAEEQAFVQIEEQTGIPGFGALLKGQKAKKEAKKEKERQNQEAAITIAAVASAGVTGGVSMYALAAYKAKQGYETGGAKGAIVAGAAGLATAYSGGVFNAEMTYDEKNGLQGNMGVGYKGANVALNYSKEGGWGGNAGMSLDGSANLGLSYNRTEGLGANVGIDPKLTGGAGLTLRHTEYGGTSGSIDFNAAINEEGTTTAGGALTFNQTEGWGAMANVGKKADSGQQLGTASIGYLEKKGLAAAIQTGNFGATEHQAGKEFGGNFAGVSGGLSFNATDGASANLNLGGVNAFIYSQAGGLSANTNFQHQFLEARRIEGARKEQQARKKELAEAGKAELAKINALKVKDRDFESMEELDAYLKANPEAKIELEAQGIQFADGSSRGEGWLNQTWGAVKEAVGIAFGYSSSQYLVEGDRPGTFKIRTCFEKNTPVLNREGPKAIDKQKLGDHVFAFNEKTGTFGWYPVTRIFVRTSPNIHRLKLSNGANLGTTWSHKFYVVGKGWVQAQNIFVGDFIHTPASMEAKVLEKSPLMLTGFNTGTDAIPGQTRGLPARVISHEIEPGETTVYNIEVEGAHTYFVGGPGAWVLVHNPDGYGPDLTIAGCAIGGAVAGPPGAGVGCAVGVAADVGEAVVTTGLILGAGAAIVSLWEKLTAPDAPPEVPKQDSGEGKGPQGPKVQPPAPFVPPLNPFDKEKEKPPQEQQAPATPDERPWYDRYNPFNLFGDDPKVETPTIAPRPGENTPNIWDRINPLSPDFVFSGEDKPSKPDSEKTYREKMEEANEREDAERKRIAAEREGKEIGRTPEGIEWKNNTQRKGADIDTTGSGPSKPAAPPPLKKDGKDAGRTTEGIEWKGSVHRKGADIDTTGTGPSKEPPTKD